MKKNRKGPAAPAGRTSARKAAGPRKSSKPNDLQAYVRDRESFQDSAHGTRGSGRPGGKYGAKKTERPGRPKGGVDRRERSADRPKISKGPWSDNAYLPSSMVNDSKLRAKSVKVDEKSKPRATKRELDALAADTPTDHGGKERLQKVLARAGVASRRAAETLILEGSVTVNGRPVTELGTRVDATADKIKVNGKLIMTEVEPLYVAFYKPKGMISAMSDPEGRPHLGQITAQLRERVIPVGRLDYNSEGLIILTNDGDLADKIVKARGLPKVYMVKVKGHPKDAELDFLKRGFFSADGVVRFASYGVEQSLRSKSWLKLEVVEGSKLDLRELLNHKGLLVDRIIRTAIGSLSIKGLNPGEYKLLKRADVEKLLAFSNK